MRKIRFLVELCLVESERVDDVDYGLLAVIDAVLALLCRGVGTGICGEVSVRRLCAFIDSGVW